MFLRGFNYSFPTFRKHIGSNIQNEWITKGILVSCRRKKELHIFNKYTYNEQIKTYYKKYCVVLTKVIQKSKKLYYKQALEKSNNKIKTTWNIINKEK
jgi:late competence protein required for DNA uptake (superfamily II DNA/RNA helicase)